MRTRLAIFMAGGFWVAHCGSSLPPSPKPIVASAPSFSAKHPVWLLPDSWRSSPTVSASVPVPEHRATLFAGMGDRWLRLRDGQVIIAETLLADHIMDIQRTDSGDFWLYGAGGWTYRTDSPLGAPIESHRPPKRYSCASKGKNAIIGGDPDSPIVYRSTDNGASWTTYRLPTNGYIADLSMTREGEGVALVLPQSLWLTDNDGADWKPIANPSFAVSQIDTRDDQVVLSDMDAIPRGHLVYHPPAIAELMPGRILSQTTDESETPAEQGLTPMAMTSAGVIANDGTNVYLEHWDATREPMSRFSIDTTFWSIGNTVVSSDYAGETVRILVSRDGGRNFRATLHDELAGSFSVTGITHDGMLVAAVPNGQGYQIADPSQPQIRAIKTLPAVSFNSIVPAGSVTYIFPTSGPVIVWTGAAVEMREALPFATSSSTSWVAEGDHVAAFMADTDPSSVGQGTNAGAEQRLLRYFSDDGARTWSIEEVARVSGALVNVAGFGRHVIQNGGAADGLAWESNDFGASWHESYCGGGAVQPDAPTCNSDACYFSMSGALRIGWDDAPPTRKNTPLKLNSHPVKRYHCHPSDATVDEGVSETTSFDDAYGTDWNTTTWQSDGSLQVAFSRAGVVKRETLLKAQTHIAYAVRADLGGVAAVTIPAVSESKDVDADVSWLSFFDGKTRHVHLPHAGKVQMLDVRARDGLSKWQLSSIRGSVLMVSADGVYVQIAPNNPLFYIANDAAHVMLEPHGVTRPLVFGHRGAMHFSLDFGGASPRLGVLGSDDSWSWNLPHNLTFSGAGPGAFYLVAQPEEPTPSFLVKLTPSSEIASVQQMGLLKPVQLPACQAGFGDLRWEVALENNEIEVAGAEWASSQAGVQGTPSAMVRADTHLEHLCIGAYLSQSTSVQGASWLISATTPAKSHLLLQKSGHQWLMPIDCDTVSH